MKVVLLKDVPDVGRKNEVKNVSDGYAFNFLIPRKLAEMGTPQAIAKVERTRNQQETERRIQTDLLLKNIKALEGMTLELSEKANEKGHLFSGIHKETIATELKKQKRIDILPEFVELPKPIKEAGEYKISLKAQDKIVELTLVVKPL